MTCTGPSIGPVVATGGTFIFTNLSTSERFEATYVGTGVGASPLPVGLTVSLGSMPSKDGTIYSFQKISKIDDLVTGITTVGELSATVGGGGGSFLVLLFGVSFGAVDLITGPPAQVWSLYTLLTGKQVLAIAGLPATHIGSTGGSVSSVSIKFVKWKKL
jgi:hypothetical protein